MIDVPSCPSASIRVHDAIWTAGLLRGPPNLYFHGKCVSVTVNALRRIGIFSCGMIGLRPLDVRTRGHDVPCSSRDFLGGACAVMRHSATVVHSTVPSVVTRPWLGLGNGSSWEGCLVALSGWWMWYDTLTAPLTRAVDISLEMELGGTGKEARGFQGRGPVSAGLGEGRGSGCGSGKQGQANRSSCFSQATPHLS